MGWLPWLYREVDGRVVPASELFLGKYSLNQEVLTALYAEKIYQGQWDWVILSAGLLIMAGYLRQCTNFG